MHIKLLSEFQRWETLYSTRDSFWWIRNVNVWLNLNRKTYSNYMNSAVSFTRRIDDLQYLNLDILTNCNINGDLNWVYWTFYSARQRMEWKNPTTDSLKRKGFTFTFPVYLHILLFPMHMPHEYSRSFASKYHFELAIFININSPYSKFISTFSVHYMGALNIHKHNAQTWPLKWPVSCPCTCVCAEYIFFIVLSFLHVACMRIGLAHVLFSRFLFTNNSISRRAYGVMFIIIKKWTAPCLSLKCTNTHTHYIYECV